MESPSVAEQRATAVAKLKRAASLPRMKDGRRPPMHVEAVSEGERQPGEDKPDEDSAPESEGKRRAEVLRSEEEEVASTDAHRDDGKEQEGKPSVVDTEELAPSPERPTTPGRKRRSRSRTRSRGSKDLRKQAKPTIVTNATESSADETNASGAGDDVPPPSPPLISPIPSHFGVFPASRLLRSPISPGSPLFYPGTQPPTPMLPSLDDLQRGLFRSNSAGAARAMAMQKLTGEPLDLMSMSPSPTPPPFGLGARLARNNTVAGGERIAARQVLLRRLGERIEKADGEQTSGGEEITQPVALVSGKRRRRRSRRSSSRASIVLDDRDDRELPSTSPNTPLVPSSSLPRPGVVSPDPPWPPEILSVRKPATTTPAFQYESPMGGRGVLVEPEDEDVDRVSPRKSLPLSGLPVTPARLHGPRLPHTSDAPSSASTDSAPASAIPVPFFLSSRNGAYKADAFPASPFATPLKEKPEFNDEDEESETYAESRTRSAAGSRAAFERDSEISWVADPVPRMPVNDDDDDDSDQGDAGSAAQNTSGVIVEPIEPGSSGPSLHTASPLSSPRSKDLIVEADTSPDISPPLMPPPPFSSVALTSPTAERQAPAAQPSPSIYPMRLSVATPNQLDRAPSTVGWHDDSVVESTPKRAGEGTWERVKNAFSRSNSSTGRRSRTNSLGGGRDRRYNTDSSVSRESGASQLSPKDKNESFAQQQVQQSPLMQTPSASASILSLSSPAVISGSPIPPATSADLYKYADSKLNPFPGIKQLEEQRNRAKGFSSPDIVLTPHSNGNGNGIEAVPSSGSSSSATTRSPEIIRERKLSHQMSDSRLVTKYNGLNSPPMTTSATSSASQADYFSLSSSTTSAPSSNGTSGSLKLPMNREGVKTWLKVKKLLTSQSSTPATPPPMSPPPVDIRAPALKKPSLSDLLSSRKDIDLSTDWEEVNSRTPVSAINTTATSHLAKYFAKDGPLTDIRANGNGHVPSYQHSRPETPQSPRIIQPLLSNASLTSPASPDFSGFPSPPDPPSSTTPDPQSSLDEFPARSTTDSYSSLSSSIHSPEAPLVPSRSTMIMERLEDVFGRGSKSSFLPSALDDPPRKLVLSSPVLQVANANTVKDRFLFLFSDLMVIAKPVVQDQDALSNEKPGPVERKFLVKNVVLLKDLKFCADREDSHSKTSALASSMRHPVIRTFIHQFTKDPDHAISTLFDKSSCRDDPVALGQLMFRAIDLDRSRLGEYLARRTSKVVLKAFLDGFGFTGFRIDKALRVFLLAICMPKQTSATDFLFDAFASRWYEANSKIVAYDRDVATKLVRSIIQLNEVLHGAIAQTPGVTGYPKRNIMSQDFIAAFKRIDHRSLVSDDLLEKIYASIRRERLSQARSPSVQNSPSESVIVVKRPLPPRLTYRVQSEPIVIRIPQPDPQFSIQLFGQDLIFDPPTLTFTKSSEASFRVVGTSLGPKSIIMWRSGPNALAYSGLPQSNLVVVERSFMRNTFQLAFADHAGGKRKYMFSVDDLLIRHQWTVSIKRQIEIAATTASATLRSVEASGHSARTHEACEALAFRVLQDTLVNSDGDIPSAIDEALARLNGSSSYGDSIQDNAFSSNGAYRRRRSDGSALHTRSKSRSQVYHKHGPGKLEPEDDSSPSGDDGRLSAMQQRPGAHIWNGRDIEVVCQQNSTISSVLKYLLGTGSDQHDASGS